MRHTRALFVTMILALASASLLTVRGTESGRVSPEPSGGTEATASQGPFLGSFVENLGQDDSRARYSFHDGAASYWFTDRGVRMGLPVAGSGTWGVDLALVGAGSVRPIGRGEQVTRVSHFHGDPQDWVAGARTYAAIRYPDSWPGVDLRYSTSGRSLKYGFRVEPGAGPGAIGFDIRGATSVEVLSGGELRIATPAGTVTDAPPTAFQLEGERRVPVPVAYRLQGNEVGFSLGDYDPRRSLLIDPKIVYSGYVGGDASDPGSSGGVGAITVDGAGAAYLTGLTADTDFPVTPGAYDTTSGMIQDAFVAKVRPDGSGFEWATFLGGDNFEVGSGVALDAAGNVLVVGSVDGPPDGFPTTPGAYDTTHNGDRDAFVAKLDPSGSTLLYSTFLGGGGFDGAEEVIVDQAGSAHVAGAGNAGFPTTAGAYATMNAGNGDAVVFTLDPTGASLVASTFLGGPGSEYGASFARDQGGNFYVTGTAQEGFPTPAGFDTSYNGDPSDIFVSKLNPSLSQLVYSTYLGGSSEELSGGIAVDDDGSAYVSGGTAGEGFPTTGPDSSLGGTRDGFVAKLDPAGTGLVYSTLMGGSEFDRATDVAIDPMGAAYVGGFGGPGSFARSGPGPSTPADGFVVKVNPAGTAFVYIQFLGGSENDNIDALALDGAANVYAAGSTDSPNFPVVVGPDTSYGGGNEGFVTKLETTERCAGKPVTLLGTPGKDNLKGTGKADVIAAGDGNDKVNAKGGKDRVCGGKGNDKLKGGGGNDRLNGEKGNDDLTAGGGTKDRCKGGPGKDDGKACEKGKV